jgi:hypothetical protein
MKRIWLQAGEVLKLPKKSGRPLTTDPSDTTTRRWAKEILERELRERERAEEEHAVVVDAEHESTSTATPLALLLQPTAKIRLAFGYGVLESVVYGGYASLLFNIFFVFRISSGVWSLDLYLGG